MIARRRTRAWCVPAALLALIGVTVAGGLLATRGTASPQPHFGTWAPGIAGDVAATHSIPAVAAPSADLAATVTRVAKETGGSAASALSTLRELRTGLGASRASLYTFSPGEGALCLMLWNRSAACPTAPSNPTPELLWLVDGGYPAGNSSGIAAAPPSLAGLVTDNVRAVTFISNGARTRLPLVHNSFFVELQAPGAGLPWATKLDVAYRDGTVATVDIPDPWN